jgi:hypothetical protein
MPKSRSVPLPLGESCTNESMDRNREGATS